MKKALTIMFTITKVNMVIFLRSKGFNVTLFCP